MDKEKIYDDEIDIVDVFNNIHTLFRRRQKKEKFSIPPNLLGGGGAVSYDADYQTWLTRLTALGYTHPNDAYKTKGSAMMAYLRAQGQLTKMKFLFVAKVNSGAENSTLVDWIVPSRAPLTTVSTPVFTADAGWKSSTSGEFSGLTANDYYGTNVRTVSFGIIFKMNTALPVGRYPAAFQNAVAGFAIDNTGLDNSYGMFSFSGTADSVLHTLTNGQTFHISFVRTDASNVTPYVDGVAKTPIAKAQQLTNGTLFICSRGGTGYYDDIEYIIYGADNTVDMAILQTAFSTYLA